MTKMRIKFYKEFGALNSLPVFRAAEQGLRSVGATIVNENEDIPVIWSVLWKGRMRSNQNIYEKAKKNNKKILILEVGNLIRGKTWRISFDNINGLGYFANDLNLDQNRPKKLGLKLENYQKNRDPRILICTQEDQSLQWKNMPSIVEWLDQTILEIEKYTDRKIIVRPHPRNIFTKNSEKFTIEIPKKIIDSYDNFDINYNYHCVINFNSGPAVQAIIAGTPIICDVTSLAYPVSNSTKNIENLEEIDRENWFVKLTHTEWTLEEIADGIPFKRIFSDLL